MIQNLYTNFSKAIMVKMIRNQMKIEAFFKINHAENKAVAIKLLHPLNRVSLFNSFKAFSQSDINCNRTRLSPEKSTVGSPTTTSTNDIENKLLEKIEALTLFIIEQNKKSLAQQQQINALLSEIDVLKARLNK